MTWLHRFGYQGLSMRELLPYIEGEKQGKVFGITFDDGYRNVFNNAMPVLNNLGFTATNYIVSRQFGGSNIWDSEVGVPHSELMSTLEIKTWIAAGHEIGSHTLDHLNLVEVSPEIAAHQILHSKVELQDTLGIEVNSFCYPYGGESAAVRTMVQEAGYSNATTTNRGRASVPDDIFGLPRIPVTCSPNIVRFLQKCMTRLEDKRGAKLSSNKTFEAI